jgi:hypothetical protein
MKNSGIVILSIGLLFTLLTTFGLLSEEHGLGSNKIQAVQEKIHHQIWQPLVGGAVVIIGAGIYMMGRKEKVQVL